MKTSLLLGTTLGVLLLAGSASAATTDFNVKMSGMQEVPAVTTSATGSGTLTFDDATKKLSGMVTLTGLADATAAHIHEAECGMSGGVAVALTADKDMLMIDATLSDTQVTSLMAGKLYVNVHTTAQPNGELRGQLVPPGGAACGDDPMPDGGASSSSGSTSSSGGADAGGTGSSSGGTSSGSNGAVTTRPSDTTAPASSSDDGGCSTTGGAPGSAVLAIGVGLAVAALSRGRRKR